MSTSKASAGAPVLHTHEHESSETVSRDSFAAAMRRFPSGVVVITTLVDGRPWGVTLSSLSSFSGEPARVSFSITKHTATAQHIQQDGSFGVAILSEGAAERAARQATPGKPKFLDEEGQDGQVLVGEALGMPLLPEAIANLECKVILRLDVRDHYLIVADVVSISDGVPDAGGLVYVNREFGRFAGKDQA